MNTDEQDAFEEGSLEATPGEAPVAPQEEAREVTPEAVLYAAMGREDDDEEEFEEEIFLEEHEADEEENDHEEEPSELTYLELYHQAAAQAEDLVPTHEESPLTTTFGPHAVEELDDPEADPFESAEFVQNPEPRCPCVILVDSSISMEGDAMHELNEGLVQFKQALCADELAAKRVEVAVVSFGPVQVEAGFQTLDTFTPPTLEAGGEAPLGDAVELAIDLVQERKDLYKTAGVNYYRPWILLLTKGNPTGDWELAAEEIRAGEEQGSFAFFSVGVGEANMELLTLLSIRDPLKLKGLAFGDLFTWLSESLQMVSHSQLDSSASLPSPMAWAEPS